MAQYYCLVASLRDYSPGGTEKDFDALAIRGYVRENLTADDARLLDMLYTYNDIGNIVSVVMRGERFDPLGTFTPGELQEELREPERLPEYLRRIVAAYTGSAGDEEVDTSRRLENLLYEAYYREAEACGNRFLREWSRFDRTLRNMCAATAARRAGRDAAQAVVGDDADTQAIARNAGSDFGLKGESDYAETVSAILTDELNLMEKERRLDALRLAYVDELTAFSYFDTDAVLAYMVRVNMVHRWQSLDAAAGREMFDRLLSALGKEGRIGGPGANEEDKNREDI